MWTLIVYFILPDASGAVQDRTVQYMTEIQRYADCAQARAWFLEDPSRTFETMDPAWRIDPERPPRCERERPAIG